jgi:hypothetical protein
MKKNAPPIRTWKYLRLLGEATKTKIALKRVPRNRVSHQESSDSATVFDHYSKCQTQETPWGAITMMAIAHFYNLSLLTVPSLSRKAEKSSRLYLLPKKVRTEQR